MHTRKHNIIPTQGVLSPHITHQKEIFIFVFILVLLIKSTTIFPPVLSPDLFLSFPMIGLKGVF